MKYIFLIGIITHSLFVFGQPDTLIGAYRSSDKYLIIEKGYNLKFKTDYGSCLSTTIYGEGSFILDGNRIILSAKRPSDRKHSHYIIEDTRPDNTTRIRVVSDSIPVPNCNIVALDLKKRLPHYGAYTPEDGIVIFHTERYPRIEDGIIQISLLGYDSFEIPLDTLLGKSTTVVLAPYKVLNEDNILFTYLIQDEKRMITGPFFLDRKKPRLSLRFVLRVWPWNWKKYRNNIPDGTIFFKDSENLEILRCGNRTKH